MAEEVRFFLRTAAYSAVIATVYWFASFQPDRNPTGYDWAGTTLLAFTAIACGAMAGALLRFVRAARRDLVVREGSLPRRLGATLNRVIGLEHPSDDIEHSLAGGPDLLPAGSPWPIVVALAATLILLGLVYGPWLVAPGLVLLVIGVGGWISHA